MSNLGRRVHYWIELLLIDFKGRDSCSLIWLMKARGGVAEQLGVTSKSEVTRAVLKLYSTEVLYFTF